MEARAYGAGVGVGDAGNFVGGEAFNVEQVHDRTQVKGQFAHGLPHVGFHEVDGFGNKRVALFKRHIALLPSRASQVKAPVDGDAEQPCLQMLIVVEYGVVFEQSQKHILEYIFSIADAARMAQGQAQHCIAPTSHSVFNKLVRAYMFRHKFSPP